MGDSQTFLQVKQAQTSFAVHSMASPTAAMPAKEKSHKEADCYEATATGRGRAIVTQHSSRGIIAALKSRQHNIL